MNRWLLNWIIKRASLDVIDEALDSSRRKAAAWERTVLRLELLRSDRAEQVAAGLWPR